MLLTKDSIASNGILIAKKIAGSPYDHVFIYGCFRIFYALDGGPNSPKDLADRNDDSVPDYVENMLYKLETARLLLTESFHLKDPLSSGFFHEKGAKFIDVYLGDIPKEHGLVSGIVYDEKHEILAGSPFQGKSLRITLHRDLKARTETPMHEMFHVFQYNYSQFNNPWFMEGLGRWSQRIITESSGKEEVLPSSTSKLTELLNKSHEAESFWNRLSALCDDSGTFIIPDQLSQNDEIANDTRPGAKLIKAVLENTEQQCRLLQEKAVSRKLSGHAYWPREEKRSLENNKFILKAVNDAINSCARIKCDELTRFIYTIMPLISSTTADFDTPDIQAFMLALKKCNAEYIKTDTNGVLYSDHFDLHTRTITIPTLDCSNPSFTDVDLEAFKVLMHVNGNFELKNSNISNLEGLRNVETINGNFALGHSGIEHVNGLNKLRAANRIELIDMNSLVSICGFNCLSIVSDSISISNNPNLICINGFNSLTSTASSVHIDNNGALLSINGFNSLEEISNGSLHILGNGAMGAISGFNQLKKLGGDLLISKCKKLASLSGLSNLDTVKNIFLNETNLADASSLRNIFRNQKDFPGYIKITSNRISSVSFMRGLRSVASSFYLHQNNLANLEGLEALESVDASFSLGANRLNDISQLSNLKKINGVLSLSNNRLISLHGLENLQKIKTTTWNGVPLTIKFQGNEYPDGGISLTDISALSNIQEAGGHLLLHVDSDHAYAFMPGKGSAYYSNKITYCTNKTDEAGRTFLSCVEVKPMPRFSPEEARIALNNEPFLAWEPAQAERYEFVNTNVFAMNEATCQHVTMSLNIAAWLSNHFRNNRFRIHMAHMKLYVEAANAFFYPDIFVTRIEATHPMESYLKNPLLIMEVLSDATQAYDRGEKFSLYRKIPSLREYVLIDPDRRRVESFRKSIAGRWELHEFPDGANLELGCLELSIPATSLYAYL